MKSTKSSLSLSTCTGSTCRVKAIFDRLQQDKGSVFLLDGGTGEELFLNGVPDDRKIWSAAAVVNPQYHSTLKDVHRSFMQAGSQAITTNSYSITPVCGFSRDEMAKYGSKAGQLAREVASHNSLLVFGSLGPLNESYRPDLVSPHQKGVDLYKVMVEALRPHVDCFLAETMSSVEESTQAVEAVGNETPILVSYTLNSDGKLRSNESATEAIEKLMFFAERQGAQIFGVLFNCSEPEAISTALSQLKSHQSPIQKVILGAYANRLTPVPPDWTMKESDGSQPMRHDLTSQQYYEDFVRLWVDEYDVQLIGGCCGIGPGHIAKLREHFEEML